MVVYLMHVAAMNLASSTVPRFAGASESVAAGGCVGLAPAVRGSLQLPAWHIVF